MPGQLRKDIERGQAMLRQWRIVICLRRGVRTLPMLADVCGCTTRTIRRDIAVLRAVGFPIDSSARVGEKQPAYWTLGAMPEWPRDELAPIEELSPCA